MQPTAAQIDSLKLASNFAYHLWQNDTHCQQFIRSRDLAEVLSTDQVAKLCAALSQIQDQSEFSAKLRKLRASLMLLWIWQDALGLLSLESLSSALSEFADRSIVLCSDLATGQLEAKYDLESGSLGLRTVAMGKLGACELNLSSDIDLVFVYPKDGELVSQSGKVYETKLLMIKAARLTAQLLDKRTQDGFVFRVDLRLRPWGEGSDIAVSLDALEKYLSEHGRQWERFAWLKARLVTPSSEAVAEQFESIRSHFVYRYYVDYTAFAALREMKNLILKQLKQRFDTSNIKLGAGGIRDIEFIVQAYQLIHGGRDSKLQVLSCIQAIKALEQREFLTSKQAEQLELGYRFLRRTEHAIQALDDEQTQTLPDDEQKLMRLSLTLGFETVEHFLAKLKHLKSGVEEQFNALMGGRVTEPTSAYCDEFDTQEFSPVPDSEVLAEAGLVLSGFLQSKSVQRLPAETKSRLNSLWPVITHGVKLSSSPVDAAKQITAFVEAIMGRSIYLVLLKENPEAVRHLLRMLIASPLVAKELKSYPVLLDSFLINRFSSLPSKSELRDKLDQQLLRVDPSDEEQLLSAFRLFKKGELLQIAASDILSKKPLMRVSDSLTWVAESVLEVAVERIYAQMVRQYGFPMLMQGGFADESASGFAVIGYGKLGGVELSYTSDLDVVFVHGYSDSGLSSGVADASGSVKQLSGSRFSARMAQKLMILLSTQTRDGRCYEIDTRLRPSGHAGVLVTSLTALRNYQQTQAWVWEHQALVRARPICGDALVLDQFSELRAEVLRRPRDLSVIRAEVNSMRQKMRDHLGHDREPVAEVSNQADAKPRFNLKQDPGGLVDIEFIAQFAVIGFASQFGQLTRFTDNIRIFEQLEELGIDALRLSAEQIAALSRNYLKLRHQIHRRALLGEDLLALKSDWTQERIGVSLAWSVAIEPDDQT